MNVSAQQLQHMFTPYSLLQSLDCSNWLDNIHELLKASLTHLYSLIGMNLMLLYMHEHILKFIIHQCKQCTRAVVSGFAHQLGEWGWGPWPEWQCDGVYHWQLTTQEIVGYRFQSIHLTPSVVTTKSTEKKISSYTIYSLNSTLLH